jgi:hypothetical protein
MAFIGALLNQSLTAVALQQSRHQLLALRNRVFQSLNSHPKRREYYVFVILFLVVSGLAKF